MFLAETWLSETPLSQGDPKRLWIVICLWHSENCLNKTKELLNSGVILGGLLIDHYFTWGQICRSLKKQTYCLEINGKWVIKQCAKTNYCPTSSKLLAIFEGPRRKIMAHSQISFKSWLNNVDSELYTIFFWSRCYGGLKKKVCFKVPEDKLMQHS